MARSKRTLPVNEGDWVWVSAKVARVVTTEDGKGVSELTVVISGTGHRETMVYNPDSIRPYEAIEA